MLGSSYRLEDIFSRQIGVFSQLSLSIAATQSTSVAVVSTCHCADMLTTAWLGISMRPSGRLSSSLINSERSSVAGIRAEHELRLTISFGTWCLCGESARRLFTLIRTNSFASTWSLHTSVWDTRAEAESHMLTAASTASSSRRTLYTVSQKKFPPFNSL